MRKELSIIARIYPYLIAVIICYGIYWLYGPCYSTKDINEEKKNASVIIEALEKYYNDHKKYPLYLDELISSCYLEQIPECKIGKDKKFNYRISKKNNFQEFMLSFSTNGKALGAGMTYSYDSPRKKWRKRDRPLILYALICLGFKV